jgi:two-component system, chemotaxis family, chemotaxis protein CheY
LLALVIDDSRAMRTILGRLLKNLGYGVEEAGNGREALERLRQGPRPDLALVDWNMPEMNGIEFVRAARADPAFRDLRLVMVTTETEAGRIGAALEAGADEYVMKPFTADALQQKLELIGIGPR